MGENMDLKLLSGEQLTEEEMRMFVVWGDSEYGEKHRWSTSVTTYYTVTDDLCHERIFALDWEEGNTEMQEHEFYNQPYEVELILKMVEVKEYVRKQKK